ncbi:hypothetical protein Tco_0155858 [Tanacetum coccineum]
MEGETRTGEEYWKSRIKLQCCVNRNSEPYVPFPVKFPHFQSRPDLPPDRSSRALTLNYSSINHPAHSRLCYFYFNLSGANAQGVAQISNGVSVLNLGGIPNPAAAAADSSAATSSSGNNNY